MLSELDLGFSPNFQTFSDPFGVSPCFGSFEVSFAMRVGGGIFSKGADIGADLVSRLADAVGLRSLAWPSRLTGAERREWMGMGECDYC